MLNSFQEEDVKKMYGGTDVMTEIERPLYGISILVSNVTYT